MGKHRVLAAASAAVALACLAAAGAAGPRPAAAEEQRNAREEKARPGEDTSGRVQRGGASYYHPRFEGRPMANGERFDAQSNSAASRTLPLGTTARVTNTETGRSATVEVEDRGPYAGNRILDVSPRVAEELGMKRDGTARVEVAPVEVPQRDGGPGEGRRR